MGSYFDKEKEGKRTLTLQEEFEFAKSGLSMRCGYTISTVDKLLGIVSDSKQTISDRKTACSFVACIIGESTEELRALFLKSAKVLMDDPNFIDRYIYFFSVEEQQQKFNGFIVQELHEWYFKNFPEPLIYRILSAGYLLEYKVISVEFRTELENYLIDLASKKIGISENMRAECADIISRVGRDETVRSIGKAIIAELGTSKVCVRGMDTIYTNRQNAHSTDIMNSALETLRKIECSDFERVSLTKIKNELGGNEIDGVLVRIFIDQTKFDGYTLPTILYMVWHRIYNNPELKKRLRDELLDMARQNEQKDFEETKSMEQETKLMETEMNVIKSKELLEEETPLAGAGASYNSKEMNIPLSRRTEFLKSQMRNIYSINECIF